MYVRRVTFCFIFIMVLMYVAVSDAATGDDDVHNSTTSEKILLFLKNHQKEFTKLMQNLSTDVKSLKRTHFTNLMQDLSNDVKWLKSEALKTKGQRYGSRNLTQNGQGKGNLSCNKTQKIVTTTLDKVLEKINGKVLEIDNVSDPQVYKTVQDIKDILHPLLGYTGTSRKCQRYGNCGMYDVYISKLVRIDFIADVILVHLSRRFKYTIVITRRLSVCR